MKYGYMDESGSPGVASYSRDCLVVSLVIFDDMEERDKSIVLIEELCEKLRLPNDYEFHCSSNSTRPQAEFLKLLSALKFHFLTVAIHKNDFKRTASYSRIAGILLDEIEKRFTDIKIEMDSNPALYTELRKHIHERKLAGIKIRERNSRNNRLIQVADYVVNISAKKAKMTPKSHEWYAAIAKKVSIFIETAD